MADILVTGYAEMYEAVVSYIRRSSSLEQLLADIESGDFEHDIKIGVELENASEALISRLNLAAAILNETQARTEMVLRAQHRERDYLLKFNELSGFITKLANETEFVVDINVNDSRVCDNKACKKVFTPLHHQQKYCCPKCRKQASNRRANGTDHQYE